MATPAYQIEVTDKPRSTHGNLENIHTDNSNWLNNFSPSQDFEGDSFNDYVNYRKRKIRSSIPISRNPRALMEIGDLHVARGKFKHAIQPYQNAIKLNPDSVEGYRKLIPVLLIVKDFDKAEKNYRKLIELTNEHPSVVNEFFGFKIATIQNKDDAETLKVEVKKAIKTSKEVPAYFVTLGLIYLVHLADVDKAQNNFEYAHKLDAKNIDAVNNLGICFQRKSEHENAHKYYLQALEIDKFYVPAYENIASNAAAQNNYFLAVEYLEKAKALNIRISDDWDHNYGWFLIQIDQIEKAATWYENKIPEQPQNSFLYNNLGVCLERLGKLEEAKDYYFKSVQVYGKLQKSNPGVYDTRAEDGYLNACRMLQKFSQFQDLEDVAKEMLTIGIVPEAGFYYLGSASIQLGKYSVAEDYLLQSLSIRDDVVDPYIDLGYFYDSISLEYNKAIDLLEKGLTKKFDNTLIYNNLAYAYLKTNQLSKAKNIISKDLKDPSFNATKGLYFLLIDKLESANKEYASAIEALPENKREEAQQVWKYELAAYWLRKNNLDKAYDLISESKKISSKFVIYPQVLDLEKEIRELKRSSSLQQ